MGLLLITTKGRYALYMLIDLAEHQADGIVPLKEVVKRLEISEKYLEAIMKVLVKNGVVTGTRGKGGGYRFNQSAEQVTVGDILRMTEDSLASVSCLEKNAEACPRAAQCRTLPLWQGLDRVIQEYLDQYTIADLMRFGQPGDDYVI